MLKSVIVRWGNKVDGLFGLNDLNKTTNEQLAGASKQNKTTNKNKW